jgi:cell division protein FtsI/penicillin-binding protein 2
MPPAEQKTERRWQASSRSRRDLRVEVVRWGITVFALFIAFRLFGLQIVQHDFYQALASGQHEIFEELIPRRGDILIHDGKDGTTVPLATTQELAFVYAEPRRVEDPVAVSEFFAVLLGLNDEETIELAARLSKKSDPFEPIAHKISNETLAKIKEKNFTGVLFVPESSRLYPEPDLGGQLVGFLGYDAEGGQAGRYGVEGYFNKELAGKAGSLRFERDISGRLIALADRALEPAEDGATLLLTLDRTIQFMACRALKAAVKKHGADGGSVIIVEPATGRILAMCGAPDFDPNRYREEKNLTVFNNPAIFLPYEPGSIFKSITMAAALDTGAVEPTTTFEDTGSVEVDDRTIRNSDLKAHGTKTMTEALEESLNVGLVFAMRQTTKEKFIPYVKNFGFGERTGIELETEAPGNVSALNRKGEIFAASASFGQGITVTPLQMAMAYAAIANGGILKKPMIVDEVRHADGTVEKRQGTDVRRVIEAKTSRLLGAMLISVVDNGHGGRAGVKGYYIAGKTGTAQVAKADGSGYEEDVTIGSFAGFGPVENPKFAMVVRIDHPRDIPWAESTAAPVFGEIAAFLLKYLEVPPTR